MRIKEYEFIKDLMKKLVYSLEQLSVQHLDEKKNVEESLILPRLLSNSPTNKKAIDNNNSMEVMMVKRMNYIRNSLDVHNPREVT